MLKGMFLIISIVILSCSSQNSSNGKTITTDSMYKPSTKNEVAGVARIEPKEGILPVIAGTNGRVLKVLIEENEEVRRYQPLIEIDLSVENAQVRQAESKIATQKASLEEKQAILRELEVIWKSASTTLERNKKLYDAKAITKVALQQSETEANTLNQKIQAAKATIIQDRSRLKELKSDINYYNIQTAQKRITALQNGKILAVSVKPGDYVTPSTKIAELAPAGSLMAKTEVDELFAERVKNGQKAYIFSQTTGDTLATGTVEFTADYLKQKSLFDDQATEQEDRRVREVHIRLQSGKVPLIGSRVDCLILLN